MVGEGWVGGGRLAKDGWWRVVGEWWLMWSTKFYEVVCLPSVVFFEIISCYIFGIFSWASFPFRCKMLGVVMFETYYG